MWTAAGLVGHADDHLSSPLAHRLRQTGAVVLHGQDGVIVAAVHAAAVPGGFPDLTIGAGNTSTVCAGCTQTPPPV